jgi:hypothetical protein
MNNNFYLGMFTPIKKGFDNPEYLSDPKRNHHQKCVCEICTCGKL